jgi:hypothetical protein
VVLVPRVRFREIPLCFRREDQLSGHIDCESGV